jgi:1A family penicillin-binding protein
MNKLDLLKNKIKKIHFLPKLPRKRDKINWKKILQYFYIFILSFLLLTGVAFAWFSKDLPTPSKIANRKATESTKIYDRTGQILLYETGEQKRTIVQSDQISQNLKDATIAVEDANFYHHHGFSPKGLARAVVCRITHNCVSGGGSTLTQQYVKNALLTSDHSLVRKIKELILAIELEAMYNKDEILTMYLNEIPYGNNTAGAEAAARVYFGKSAKDLTLAEAATLAAIPKAPTYYSPYGVHIKDLINRRNYVLDRMVDTSKISRADAEKAKQDDTTTLGMNLKPRRDSILAPHFAMYVLEQVANEYGEDKIQKEGLKIITTLDYEMQKKAEQAVTDGITKVIKYGGSNAALVAVDPKTGQILTMVGSRDYFNTEIDGNVNVTDSLRQPGSSFKPFAYATAFKKKEYSPSKIIFDLQTDFGGGYVPHNYTNRNYGPVTMRTALSNSLNVPAVKVLSLAGLDNTLRTASDMGITTLNQRSRYGLSLVLGSGEVKPVEMAGAFGVFATGGVKHDLNPILKLVDSNNKTIYEYKPEKDPGKNVLDPQIAYEISDILSDKVARTMIFGSRTLLNFPDRTVAAKTGTTSDFKDAWTVGYTPSLAVAVWVGNNDAKPMSSGADGSVVATPIFRSFVDKALEGVKSEEFPRPDGITELDVEKYSNKLPSQYSTQITHDIFASWQVPTDKDDVHIALKLCKNSDKLAPDGFPDALTETRVLTIIHSERPDYPNWEGPVQSWAQGNGFYGGTIPTDYCKLDEVTPAISITNPTNNSQISGSVTFSISQNNSINLAAAEYYLDNISIGRTTTPPFSLEYDTGTLLTSSAHKLKVIVTSEFGTTATDEINFYISKDTLPPTISGVGASPTKNSANISWITNENSTSQVFYDILPRPANTNVYTFKTAQASTYTANHNATLTGLNSITKYYYRVVSIDAAGNVAVSEEKTFTTLP